MNRSMEQGKMERFPKALYLAAIFVAILWLVLFYWSRTALAVDVTFQSAEGEMPPEGKTPVVFQQVDVSIHNQVAAAQHWYHFKNEWDRDVEVTCQFVLAAEELVEGFSYYNGAERIVGEVLEKQVAQQVYQELTGVQRDPGLLEKVGDRFRFRVFPIQPGENKPVELRTMLPLEMREEVVEYVVPKENLPTGGTVFSLRVDIADDLPVKDIETVGFKGIIKSFGPRHHRIVFEQEDASFDQDLVIRYRLEANDYSMRFVSHKGDGADGAFMLLVTPKAEVEAQEVIGRDIVFVMDISGSMAGQPLEQTKWGLAYIIERLNPDDRFDVVAFDDEPSPFFSRLVVADEENISSALLRASGLETRGGTNIRGALAKAMEQLEQTSSGRPRAIIFLTDGQGNSPAEVILAEVRKRDSGIRIYTFGVGSGVNRPFLERLARDNRGIGTFVQQTDQIEKEMQRLYDRISMPLMVDLQIEFDGLSAVDVYPKRLPDLYRDGQVVVFGRFTRPGEGTIRVSGYLKGRQKVLSLPVSLPREQEKFAYVEKLWASRRINHLMDMVHDRGDAQELVKEVTRLGIVYNLVTDYTTFLAVPESLKTQEIKELIKSGKQGYDHKLIDGLKDVRLSMQDIPPGDPVITVEAPEDAAKVVAYFPFGLVLRLKWDPIRKYWAGRFLVPRHVEDGVYKVKVHVVLANGVKRWKQVTYRIDGTAPEFTAELPEVAPPGCIIPLEVDPFEPVKEVYAYFPGVNEDKIELEIDLETGTYGALIKLPDRFINGRLTITIVVRDRAGNKHIQQFDIFEEDVDVIGC